MLHFPIRHTEDQKDDFIEDKDEEMTKLVNDFCELDAKIILTAMENAHLQDSSK